jgi:hypothetical protein
MTRTNGRIVIQIGSVIFFGLLCSQDKLGGRYRQLFLPRQHTARRWYTYLRLGHCHQLGKRPHITNHHSSKYPSSIIGKDILLVCCGKRVVVGQAFDQAISRQGPLGWLVVDHYLACWVDGR